MKKRFLILLAAMLLLAAACGTNEGQPAQAPKGDTGPAQAPEAQAPKADAGAVQAPQNDTQSEPAEPEAEPEPTRPPALEEPVYEPLPEEAKPVSERVLGEWFANYAGLAIPLTLAEDGSYTLTLPAGEPQAGKWAVEDGLVVFDGNSDDPLTPVNDVLRWESSGLLFTRKKPETYVPAELSADVKEGSFDGYWKAQFVAVGDGTVLAEALSEDTEVYIEGTNIALGGARFGQIIRSAVFADGKLTLDENGMALTLELQQDGFLRLTITGGEQPAVIYLLPAPILGSASAEQTNP